MGYFGTNIAAPCFFFFLFGHTGLNALLRLKIAIQVFVKNFVAKSEIFEVSFIENVDRLHLFDLSIPDK